MDRGVYFDEDYQIRLLDVDKYKSSKTLLESCGTFVNNMQQLQESVSSYMSIVNQQVELVEAEKLRAVGLRNRVAALAEERRARQAALAQQLKEAGEELERLTAEEAALQRVRGEQEALRARLSAEDLGAS